MPKVYVFAALMPMGGAYMAYHVGRLLHLHFGYEFVDVAATKVDKHIFTYDIPIRTMGAREMEKTITSEDILIANPSYSHLLFGLRLPGRKIMYIQDFKTFTLLDCHFDLYVSVSDLVQRFISAIYGRETPVIPAFIETSHFPQIRPWSERPPGSALIYKKHADVGHQIALDYMTYHIRVKTPEIDLSRIVQGRGRSHEEFLEAIASVRYFINLSLVEGFGLVPLEAMALGTMVTGTDSLGSAQYMRNEHNCLVASPTDLRALPEVVRRAFNDEALAQQCVENARLTARQYEYAAFKEAWLVQLSQLLKKEPQHV